MKTGKTALAVVLALHLLLFEMTGFSSAQNEDDYSAQEKQTASQYYLERGTENKLMMKVNVWGAVKEPGSQYVPDGTDLISVLSAAGGPTDGAKLSKVRLVRNFNGEEKNLVINLGQCLKRGKVESLPEIKPGDTVIVPKSKVSFGKFLGVIYNVAVIASVVKLMSD
jgi:polysaccharide export outer membrane protein